MENPDCQIEIDDTHIPPVEIDRLSKPENPRQRGFLWASLRCLFTFLWNDQSIHAQPLPCCEGKISTRIAMDHLTRGLKLKVSFLLLTWQVWQGGYWLIDFQKIAQVLSWRQWGSNSVLLPVSQSVSRSTHLRSGAYSVGGSCFVNNFLSRCRQLYTLQSTASSLTIRLPSSKHRGSWHGLWLPAEVLTGLCPCEMPEQGRLGKRLALPCVLWQGFLPSFAQIPELVASCFARQCKLPKQQSLLLSMRCEAWRPSCMQAPADPNPYSIAFTSFCQRNSFTWSSGRRLLILRHCSVSITTLVLNGCLPFTREAYTGLGLVAPELELALGGNGGSCKPTKVEVANQQQPNAPKCLAYPRAMSLMRCAWARKRGILGRLAIELQSDAVAKSPIKPRNVPLSDLGTKTELLNNFHQNARLKGSGMTCKFAWAKISSRHLQAIPQPTQPFSWSIPGKAPAVSCNYATRGSRKYYHGSNWALLNVRHRKRPVGHTPLCSVTNSPICLSCGRLMFLPKRRTGNLQLMVRSHLQRLESYGIPAAPEWKWNMSFHSSAAAWREAASLLTPTISATAAVKAFMCCGAPATFMTACLQLCGRCSASITPKNVPTQPLHVKTLLHRTTWRWLQTIPNIFEPCSFWHLRIVLMWLARLPDKIKKRSLVACCESPGGWRKMRPAAGWLSQAHDCWTCQVWREAKSNQKS